MFKVIIIDILHIEGTQHIEELGLAIHKEWP